MDGEGALMALRKELLARIDGILRSYESLPESKAVQASAVLRLYAALRGIASLKSVYCVQYLMLHNVQ